MKVFQNQNGLGLLSSIIIAMGLAYTAITSISTLLPVLKSQEQRSSQYLELKGYLDGLVDYTTYAIEQRWF